MVTGSRIQRPNLEAAQPLLVISSERIEAKGQTNLAEAINDSPSSGVPINPIGDQGSFGTGRNYVNLLNLGTNRTLTLVNGRRFVGSNAASLFTGAAAGGQVDLNGIPTGLVDRTERVFGTGGAVYGSDA
ncbi:TonB-dependent receptor plug domain-containing protein, partial [Phenylobacterium sp.]|uniref:TonB-dependent receptor plug domain-containing protein n=1 Tax=Phenylobacterium sp. TaxID=1871053 RepID=UPI002FDD5343